MSGGDKYHHFAKMLQKLKSYLVCVWGGGASVCVCVYLCVVYVDKCVSLFINLCVWRPEQFPYSIYLKEMRPPRVLIKNRKKCVLESLIIPPGNYLYKKKLLQWKILANKRSHVSFINSKV